MWFLKQIAPYTAFLGVAVVLAWATHELSWLQRLFLGTSGHEGFYIEGFYLALALLFAVGYGLNRFAPRTAVPSFVWAILFGMALQLPLTALTGNTGALLIVIELLAAFVLFAGGVEVPVKNFKKYFGPISALSLAGTVVTVFLFSYALAGLAGAFAIDVPVYALIILAAILASIDPTAIIPTLDNLHFRKPFLKDIAISESAVNDVAGSIITRFLVVSATASMAVATVHDGLAPLLTRTQFEAFALEIMWGVLVGLLGAWVLRTWGESVRATHWSDPALFFAVPIFCFALGSLIGGSGFLAAFVAGLLFEAKSETKVVRHFFETLVDSFMKPVIFILLGALAPLGITYTAGGGAMAASEHTLASTMGIGVVSAIVFMFVIRPVVVFITLLPWMQAKNDLISWREAMFLSFIRETGAIPAVLILTVVAKEILTIGDAAFVFAVGMWVILLTLVIEPPLTPLLARRLGIAK